MAIIVDGKALRDKILSELKAEISSKELSPKLAIVWIGNNEASARYINQKVKAGELIAAKVEVVRFPDSVTQADLLNKIELLNQDKSVSGIIVQLPLPAHLDVDKVVEAVSPQKDVDGLNSDSSFVPATPQAVVTILQEYKIPVKNKTAVVIGRSKLVGAPVKVLLENLGATVIQLHSQSRQPLSQFTLQGDILISAVGKINLVTADMVKVGAAVIDVGINRNDEGKLVGDVDYENVKDKVSLITPVPGGVGPLTVALLMKNLVQASY